MKAGLILAGGQSQRFGEEKAAAVLAGHSLLWRAHRKLAEHCAIVAVSAPASSKAAVLAAALDADVLGDPPGAPRGPLSGVLAGLDWARERGAALLFTLPCDTPITPPDLIARLAAAAATAPAAAARSPGGIQPLCAVWRTGLADTLRDAIADGAHPPVRGFLADVGAAIVDFADDAAFANVNTVQDLARVERSLSGA